MGKKTREKKITLAESFIQFQIEVKSKEIEEFKDEVKELEANNLQLVKLRDQLREEHQKHFSVLCKQVKELEKNLEEAEVSNKEQVKQAVQKNLELMDIHEEELEELHRQLMSVQAEVEELQAECQVWKLYKKVGSVEHLQQIQKLLSGIDSIHKTFQAKSENIAQCLKATLSEIDQSTSRLTEQVERIARERALKQVDKQSVQKIRKNKWLKKVVHVYHDEVSVMDAAVKKLEEENLEHSKQLLENRLSNISRAFLTQVEDLGQNHSLPERAGDPSMYTHIAFPSVTLYRPQEGAQRIVTEQGLSLPAEIGRDQPQQSGELEEDEMDHSCKPSSPTHHLSTMLHDSQSDLREPLHLGPLEQKILNVVGRAMSLYPLPSDSEDLDKLIRDGLFQTKDGTLTTKIIRRTFQ